MIFYFVIANSLLSVFNKDVETKKKRHKNSIKKSSQSLKNKYALYLPDFQKQFSDSINKLGFQNYNSCFCIKKYLLNNVLSTEFCLSDIPCTVFEKFGNHCSRLSGGLFSVINGAQFFKRLTINILY